jgi:hypothetical protein
MATLGATMVHEDCSQWHWRRGNLPSALGAQGSGDGSSEMGRCSEEEQVNLASIEEGIRATANVGACGAVETGAAAIPWTRRRSVGGGDSLLGGDG